MRFNTIFKTTKDNSASNFQTIPYLTLGILSNAQLIDLIGFFIDNGIKSIELGFPFSDAIADGPIIQTATQIALDNNFNPQQGFESIKHIRSQYPDLAISLMLYANSVYAYGLDEFYYQAKLSGIDAILIPDIPNIELKPYIIQAQIFEIQPVLFATPSCKIEDLQFVAKYAQGYVYCVARSGVTGINQSAQFDQIQRITTTLQQYDSAPIVCGFGIKNNQDLQQANKSGCQGAIIGSQLIQHLTQIQYNLPQRIKNLKQDFTQNMHPRIAQDLVPGC